MQALPTSGSERAALNAGVWIWGQALGKSTYVHKYLGERFRFSMMDNYTEGPLLWDGIDRVDTHNANYLHGLVSKRPVMLRKATKEWVKARPPLVVIISNKRPEECFDVEEDAKWVLSKCAVIEWTGTEEPDLLALRKP